MAKQKPIRIIVNVPLPIAPFYKRAEEMDAIEGETATILEIAQRLAAIDADKPWQMVADVLRPFPDLQIEAEAAELLEDKENEANSQVLYSVILTFNDRFEPVDQTKTMLRLAITDTLRNNQFTFRFEDR